MLMASTKCQWTQCPKLCSCSPCFLLLHALWSTLIWMRWPILESKWCRQITLCLDNYFDFLSFPFLSLPFLIWIMHQRHICQQLVHSPHSKTALPRQYSQCFCNMTVCAYMELSVYIVDSQGRQWWYLQKSNCHVIYCWGDNSDNLV